MAETWRRLARATFDMDRYVARLRELASESVAIMRQRTEDLASLSDDPMFDPDTYLPADARPMPRRDAKARFSSIVSAGAVPTIGS